MWFSNWDYLILAKYLKETYPTPTQFQKTKHKKTQASKSNYYLGQK